MAILYCFSGSGHSLAVSKELSELLACKIVEIGCDEESSKDDVAVVVFPVYCQSTPKPVKKFLKQLQAKHIALIATYGKISYGNALYEAQRLVLGEVIAGAYIPVGHTFLDGDYAFNKEILIPIVNRIKTPKKVLIPKTRIKIWAKVFPALRSRMSVKIVKKHHCNQCGLCEKSCPMGAIRKGRIHSKCIRCMRCITVCPQKALQYKNSWILNTYLRNHHKEEYMLYL